jgi:hypothetical protein
MKILIQILNLLFLTLLLLLGIVNYLDNRQQDKIIFGTVDNVEYLTENNKLLIENDKLLTENVSDIVKILVKISEKMGMPKE